MWRSLNLDVHSIDAPNGKRELPLIIAAVGNVQPFGLGVRKFEENGA